MNVWSLPNKVFISWNKTLFPLIKLLCIKGYYCWSLTNAGSPSRCSRSWYLLNRVFHKNITWNTTFMLIKGLSWPMRMHEININSITCSYINQTNHANSPKWVVYTGHISSRTEYQHMIQFTRITLELNDDYSFWQLQCPHLHIISQSQDSQHWSFSPYKFQKLDRHHFILT